ncbi:MAG TPA: CHAT domain-containing tetratricopeptide repeat protein [Blastocatellia bacterium]|nr:CHAT domain-containing tetratricopeptide repeat protein [Blastocatellia bacterium]
MKNVPHRYWIRRLINWMTCCVVFATLAFTPSSSAHQGQDASRLEFGRSMERMISGAEIHRYQIPLNAGEYLRVAITQKGIDLVVTALDPAGRRVSWIDRPNGAYGKEPISVIAEVAGDHKIEVRPTFKLAAPASYVITATEPRKATADDSQRVAAEYTVNQGEELRSDGTADALSQAIDKFSQAAKIWRSLGDQYEEAVAIYGRGWTYQMLGDYYNSIFDYRQSALQMEALQDRYGEAVARAALAWAYHFVGELEQSEAHFRQALQPYQALGNLRGQAIAIYGIGLARQMSEPEQALEYFHRSLELRQKAGDRAGEVLTLTAIGITYDYLGRPEKTIDYALRALELANTLSKLPIRANPLTSLGKAHLTLRNLDKSRDYFEQALRIYKSTGDRASEIPVRYGLAELEMERGNLDEARRHIETSLEITESLRWLNSSLQLRSTYLATAHNHYQLYTELLMRLHRGDPAAGHAAAALQASERARARSLLDALAEAQIDLRNDVDARLVAEERRLQQKLNDLSAGQMRLLSRKLTDNQTSALDANIKATIELLEKTRADIKRTNPRYDALTQPQLVSLERIQRELLDDGTLLLEYSLGQERSYLFLVSSSSLQTYTLPPRAEIEARARRVYELLSTRALSSLGETPEQRRARIAAADAELPGQAAELSRMILSPAAGQLGQKRLLVVAQGALQLVPFAVLPEPEAGSRGEWNTEGKGVHRPAAQSPLLVNHEIVNLPSASTLAALRQEAARRQPAPKTIALLADPIFEKSDERLALAQIERATRQSSTQTAPRPLALQRTIKAFEEPKDTFTFQRLISTGWEAERIAKMAQSDQVFKALAFDANRQIATSGKLSDYRIIHFASHSYIHGMHPDLSGIVLSLVDRNGEEQDGFLRLHEIYNLKLRADLVTLSACRTGLGKEVKGEGLMSLTRGFMYAGALRVLVSAWEVQDRPSATLMVKFYRYLLGPQRLSAAAALRAAQLEMWRDKQFSAPYYWAGFTLQGEWR